MTFISLTLSQRLARPFAILLLLSAAGGAAVTLASWRADVDAQRFALARAVRWRPDVPLYRREWAESLMLASPAQALAQLREVKRQDPYDNIADADLMLVELATGDTRGAQSTAQAEIRSEPGFDSSWQLANLRFARGDAEGFWREAARSCQLADPAAFPSIVYQALAVGGGDFSRLRAILPVNSAAAALAYFNAAIARRDHAAATDGFKWLMGLPATAAAPSGLARRAASSYLALAWQSWPDDVVFIWNQGRRAGLLSGPDKNAGSAMVIDGDFDPAQFDPADFDDTTPSLPARPHDIHALTSAMGWQTLAGSAVAMQAVNTGDATHPTAAAFQFDGSESADADLDLASQWVLAPGSTSLAISAISRKLDSAPADGLSLRLVDRRGVVVGELPISIGDGWSLSAGTFHIADPALAGYRLIVHYKRPLAQLPIRNIVLLTSVRLRPVP